MKLIVCSIYDHAVGSFQQPFYSRSKGEAIRLFSDAVNDKASPFNKHPDDFSLAQVAIYEDQNGSFENHYEKILTANEVHNHLIDVA